MASQSPLLVAGALLCVFRRRSPHHASWCGNHERRRCPGPLGAPMLGGDPAPRQRHRSAAVPAWCPHAAVMDDGKPRKAFHDPLTGSRRPPPSVSPPRPRPPTGCCAKPTPRECAPKPPGGRAGTSSTTRCTPTPWHALPSRTSCVTRSPAQSYGCTTSPSWPRPTLMWSGHEALVRRARPTRGVLSPADFLDVAEGRNPDAGRHPARPGMGMRAGLLLRATGRHTRHGLLHRRRPDRLTQALVRASKPVPDRRLERSSALLRAPLPPLRRPLRP